MQVTLRFIAVEKDAGTTFQTVAYGNGKQLSV